MLGYVKYLNTLPLVQGLEAWQEVGLVPAAPSRLAEMLVEREVDMALASLVDVARAGAGGETPLTLVPAGMIGCDGPTLTVRLFSTKPMEQITTLACDTDSHTSVILAQVILAKQYGVKVRVQAFDVPENLSPQELMPRDQRLSVDPVRPLDRPRLHEIQDTGPLHSQRSRGTDAPWPESFLMIGDKVVTDAPPADRYPHQLDLGQAWKEMTGLPFVYAMWMCRSEDVAPTANATCSANDSGMRGKIISTARLLDRQRRRNTMRLDWIVQRFASERRWPDDLARKYVYELLRYEPDARAMAGAERFLEEAAGLGLLPRVPAAWLEWSGANTDIARSSSRIVSAQA